jgi:ribose/xylose/arabinose/galactoside ABC-type transport system permease subunit
MTIAAATGTVSRFAGPLGYLIVVAVFLLMAGLAATTPGFLTIANFRAILGSTTFVGLITVGMALIMISGSFVSMSLATLATVTAIYFIFALQFGVLFAIVSTMALGGFLGWIQGYLVGAWDANPIIVTIAAGALFEGASVALTAGQAMSPPSNDYIFLNMTPFGIPLGTFVLLGVVIIVEIILRRTRFGHEVYMVGESRAAARAASVSLAKVGGNVFLIAGVTAALTGIFLASFNHGASLLLNRGTLNYDAIAATLIGGTAIAGGRGSVWRALFGVVLIAIITNLVLLRGYSLGAQILFKGIIMLAFLLIIHLRSRKTR